jgi:hypothetical protein
MMSLWQCNQRIQLFALVISLGVACQGAKNLQAGVRVTSQFAGSPSFSFDSDGSVGVDHFTEISNVGLRVYDKTNGSVVLTETLGGVGGFWSDVFGTTTSAFDPRIQFDHHTQRWFAISATESFSANSAVLIGVSQSSDPTGAWRGVRVPADPAGQRWSDYPILGIDGAALYVATSLILNSGSGANDYQLFSIPKDDLIQTIPSIARLSRNQFNAIVLGGQPFRRINWPQLDPTGSSGDGQLVWTPFAPRFNSSAFDLFSENRHFDEVVGASGAGATLRGFTADALVSDLDLTQCCAPDLAAGGRQPGTTHTLGRNRGDPLYRVGDDLYHVQYIRYLGAIALHWEQIDASTDQILQQGFIGDPAYDLLDPSVAANQYGDVVIAYTRSGPSEFASAYASVGQLNNAGEIIFRDPLLLKSGSEIYDANGPVFSPGIARWSDYSSAVTVDPNDAHRFWISNAYVSGRNLASTWVSELFVTPVLPGDYDFDGDVDEADYGTWRSTFGSQVTHGTKADGNGDGVVNGADYVVWRKNLGLNGIPTDLIGEDNLASVPESSTRALSAICLSLLFFSRCRTVRPRRLRVERAQVLHGCRQTRVVRCRVRRGGRAKPLSVAATTQRVMSATLAELRRQFRRQIGFQFRMRLDQSHNI